MPKISQSSIGYTPSGGGGLTAHDHTSGGDGGTLDGPIVNDYVILAEAAAPSTPSSGRVALYAKTDGSVYQKDDAGTETGLAGGGSGGDFTLIEEKIADGTVGTYTFSSIPGTYKDLLLIVEGRGADSQLVRELRMRLNGDTTAGNYQDQRQLATGTTNSTGHSETTYGRLGSIAAATAVSGYPGSAKVTLPSYARTTFHKTWSAQGGHVHTAGNNLGLTDIWGQWKSTAAITSIEVYLESGNYVSGSTLRLYGLG